MDDATALWLHLENPAKACPSGMVDYKFYCFHGEPKFLYVSRGMDNHKTARMVFLSMDWESEPFGRDDYLPYEGLPEKPQSFEEMVTCARVLSSGLPFVRVDFYDYGGRAMFSEMTFCPCAGYMLFNPLEWDEKVGDLLNLSSIGKGDLTY